MTDLPDDRSLDSTASLVELGAQFTDLGRVMLDAEDGQLTIDRVLQYASAAVASTPRSRSYAERRSRPRRSRLPANWRVLPSACNWTPAKAPAWTR